MILAYGNTFLVLVLGVLGLPVSYVIGYLCGKARAPFLVVAWVVFWVMLLLWVSGYLDVQQLRHGLT
jgi:hypothetical protein